MNASDSNYQEFLTQLKQTYADGFKGWTVVVKYGGNAMTDDALKVQFAQNVVGLSNLGMRLIVVHGGGPQINYWLERIGKQGHFIQGMRITDDETMSVAEMVLSGHVGKELATLICMQGGCALSLSGRDGLLMRADKLWLKDETGQPVDIGQVGEVNAVNIDILNRLTALGFIPVIAPICNGEDGEVFNVNADLVAGHIAEALKADRLLLLTNIPGVLDKNEQLLPELNEQRIQALVADGTIYGGMLPKVQGALTAAHRGVGAVHILDGREPHVLLRAFLPERDVGTMIRV